VCVFSALGRQKCVLPAAVLRQMALPVVLVLGGTGKQGFGVLQALHAHYANTFRLATVTRRGKDDPTVALLQSWGVRIVCGDLEKDTAKTLAQCFQAECDTDTPPVYGVFLNLDYWTLGADKEFTIAKAVVDHAVSADTRHFIYSTLEGCSRDTGGVLSVPFFDNKVRIEEYIKVRVGFVPVGAPDAPSSFALLPAFTASFVKYGTYMENFLDGHTKLKRGAGGEYMFAYPLGVACGLTLVPVTDVGAVVARMFAEPQRSAGRAVGLAGDHLTGEEMAAVFSRVTGERAVFEDVALPATRLEGDAQHSDAIKGMNAGQHMWLYKRVFEARFKAYVADTKAWHPGVMNLEQWLRANWPRAG